MTMVGMLAIAVAGALGALARFLFAGSLHRLWGFEFPIGTLVVNVLGSVLLGGLYAVGVERNLLPISWRIPLMVGFMGSFTTFSTFSQEIFLLLEGGATGLAVLYILANIVLGVGGFAVAIYALRACG